MIVLPRHFMRFLDGRSGSSIQVGFVPGQLGSHINTLQTERTYARKLLKRRTNYEEFVEIQNTIDNGLCMRENQFQLSFLFVKEKVKPEIYFLLVDGSNAPRAMARHFSSAQKETICTETEAEPDDTGPC